jgi:hypothetical protein
MIHHTRQSAIMRDWLDGYKLAGIARSRDVSEAEALAVLLLEGVPYRCITRRDGGHKRRQYPKQRALRLAALMTRKKGSGGLGKK